MDKPNLDLNEYWRIAKILNGELAGNETREICLRRILRGYHAYIEQAQANAQEQENVEKT